MKFSGAIDSSVSYSLSNPEISASISLFNDLKVIIESDGVGNYHAAEVWQSAPLPGNSHGSLVDNYWFHAILWGI